MFNNWTKDHIVSNPQQVEFFKRFIMDRSEPRNTLTASDSPTPNHRLQMYNLFLFF